MDADNHDYLILVDVEKPASATGLIARLLHVNPSVEPGDEVEIGENVGQLVRSGYYAPWVKNHIHLGFRHPTDNLDRATGSILLELGIDLKQAEWDGTGTVVASGDTYAVLDSPEHPDPGSWAGVAAHLSERRYVIDGGVPHYDGGGLLGMGPSISIPDNSGNEESLVSGPQRSTDSIHSQPADTERLPDTNSDRTIHFDRANVKRGLVTLAGYTVGVAAGRDVEWNDVCILANGKPVRGLSLFIARDEGFGVKLVGENLPFTVGQAVSVTIQCR